MRNLELDVHTHTLMSGHAYSTLSEMIRSAADKGLKLYGITDHAPTIPNAPGYIYFRNMYLVPRHQYGMEILMGSEINILDTDGNIDMDDTHLQCLDICIAGIHSLCYKSGTKAENTNGLIKVIHNPAIHIISHPADGTTELDFEPIVAAAKESHTLLEINNSSLLPERHKAMARDNNLMILKLCKEQNVPVILGSDAHIACDIARFDYALALVDETAFPDDLIVNNDAAAFKEYLNITVREKVDR